MNGNSADPGNRRNSRLNPLIGHCAVQVRVISARHRPWRGNHPRNLPPLFGFLSLEITSSVLYTLSSKRRSFYLAYLVGHQELTKIKRRFATLFVSFSGQKLPSI